MQMASGSEDIFGFGKFAKCCFGILHIQLQSNRPPKPQCLILFKADLVRIFLFDPNSTQAIH